MATESPSWSDLAQFKKRWDGPMLVKGILTAEDARQCLEIGADGVIVSNHGGRQLDGTPATMSVLPEIVDAVGGAADVLLDGGVRRGTDVIKALALGARAVLVGRAYLWGLAHDGEAGVATVLRLLRTELVRDLKLLGCPSVAHLDRSWVTTP
jgi:isopentenyl diphosphate isomerase/L-lactate dehydrogenase-like FMN-dependent dehydrogenase